MKSVPVMLGLGVFALMAVGVACGEGGESPSAAATPTRTAAPTPTPTATATAQAPAAAGVQTLCLEVQQSYPQIEQRFSLPIAEVVRGILARLGLQVVAAEAACDATLTLALTGEPLVVDHCCLGAEVSVQVTLSRPGRAPLTLSTSERKDPTSGALTVISDCPSRAEAPFYAVWPEAVLDSLALLWPPLQVFVQALGDEEFLVRGAAARALGLMGPEAEGAVPALIQALRDQEVLVRANAASALGEIGPEAKDAVPALIQALEDEDSFVRSQAASGLAGIGPQAKDGVPALIQALEDEDWLVRAQAARGLGGIGPEAQAAVPGLMQALEDEHQQVRDEAERALNLIQKGP